jgi:hypothetical protein
MNEVERLTRKQRIDTRLRSLNPPWQIIRYGEGLDLSALHCHVVKEFPTDNGPADYSLFVNDLFLGIIFLRFAAQRVQLDSPSPLRRERAGVRGEGYPRPSDGRGAGGEGYSGDPSKELSTHGVQKTDETGSSAG